MFAKFNEGLMHPIKNGIKAILEQNGYIDKDGNILSKIKRVVIKDGEGTFDESILNKADQVDFVYQKGGILEKDLALNGARVTLAGGEHLSVRTSGDVHLLGTQNGSAVIANNIKARDTELSGILQGNVMAESGTVSKKDTIIIGNLNAKKGSKIELDSVTNNVIADNATVNVICSIGGSAKADGEGSAIVAKEICRSAKALHGGKVEAVELIRLGADARGKGSIINANYIGESADVIGGGKINAYKIARSAQAIGEGSVIDAKYINRYAAAIDGGRINVLDSICECAEANGIGSVVVAKDVGESAEAFDGGRINVLDSIGECAKANGKGAVVVAKEVGGSADALHGGTVYTNKVSGNVTLKANGSLKSYNEDINPQAVNQEIISVRKLITDPKTKLEANIDARAYVLKGGDLSKSFLRGEIEELSKETLLPNIDNMDNVAIKSLPLKRKWNVLVHQGNPNYVVKRP